MCDFFGTAGCIRSLLREGFVAWNLCERILERVIVFGLDGMGDGLTGVGESEGGL